MLLKLAGLEIEIGRGGFFLGLAGIGTMWCEMRSVVQGRQWSDYMTDPAALHLYLGRTYVVLCRSSATVAA